MKLKLNAVQERLSNGMTKHRAMVKICNTAYYLATGLCGYMATELWNYIAMIPSSYVDSCEVAT